MAGRFFTPFKSRLILCGFFLLSLLAGAAIGLPPEPAGAQEAPKNCLWSVQTESNKIYLLGSLHVLKPEAYPLAVAIESAYAGSARIIFETDIAAMQDQATQAKMLALGMYPAGQNLLQNLDGNTRRLLEKKMSALGLPLEAFSQFKPWFVALTLATLELQRLGYNPNYGVDVYFFNKAKSGGKEIGFLESPGYQINLLGNMVEKDQGDFLNQTLKDLELVGELAGDLVKNWQAGNTDKLHELLYKSFKDYPDLHDRLLIQRNKKWVKEIEGAMRKNKNFLFIVGAGHLVGPESVVDMLKKKGYEVKQQ